MDSWIYPVVLRNKYSKHLVCFFKECQGYILNLPEKLLHCDMSDYEGCAHSPTPEIMMDKGSKSPILLIYETVGISLAPGNVYTDSQNALLVNYPNKKDLDNLIPIEYTRINLEDLPSNNLWVHNKKGHSWLITEYGSESDIVFDARARTLDYFHEHCFTFSEGRLGTKKSFYRIKQL